MRYGTGQLNMAHSLPAHFRLSDLDAALFANDSTMLESFVLAT